MARLCPSDRPGVEIAWRWSPDRLGARLSAAVQDGVTSSSPGLLQRVRPPVGYGYLHAETGQVLTPEDGDRLQRALMSWELHRAAGMVTATSESAVRVGVTIVNAAPIGPLAVVAPCRVVTVIDTSRAHGFVYATLPGHPLIGEEEFVVSTADGGRWCFAIRFVSRPVGIAGWFPALARAGQRAVNRRYLAAARRIGS
jgi:uncharacterized protein (UPF0548 family)